MTAAVPGDLLLDVGRPLTGIGEDAVAPLDASGGIDTGDAGDKRGDGAGDVSGAGKVGGELTDIVRRFNEMAVIESDGEVIK